MRSEPLLAVLLLVACDEKNEGPPPERFASVKKKADTKASAFCEKTFAPGEKKFAAPKADGALSETKGWRWVNLWATWCKPCVEEMGLLNKWNEQLQVTIDLLSIDEPDADLESWKKKNLPGAITRIASPEDFTALLTGLGLDKNAAIPIHVLVDPKGDVRCVRVGSIKQENYGAVRELVSGT